MHTNHIKCREPFAGTEPSNRLWKLKYAMEWVAALLGTIAISPLLALLSILVKITSHGPVFYTSER
ncbi:MAG: hypothetical protein SVV80_10905, partial [Planctomycetota bacterium]|nr:hypothetical protein [Planctomycetota bacterium]